MRLPPLPEPPRPAGRPPFPVVAVIAPMLGAVVIGLVLGSPFMLLFAALGPIVAVASVLDARRSARRHRRLEAERFERECTLFEQAIDSAHHAERLDADRRAPHPARALALPEIAGGVRIGTAPAPSSVGADTVRSVGDSEADQRLGRLLARARSNPELPSLVPRGPIVLEGRGLVAEVIARQLERGAGLLLRRQRHDDDRSADASSAREATRIVVLSPTAVDVHEPGRAVRRVRPDFVSERELAIAVEAQGHSGSVPDSVGWRELPPAGENLSGPGSIPIGVGDAGAVVIDLIRSGPHALVGGTTGSGKSELLRALALGWAASHPPTAAQLLFVDFKGGATFARLTELPHTIGLVTDLDPVVAHRAVRSLRAELRHRERTLTEAGLRDLRDQPDLLPRLLVLVDEFATLVETFPELHAVFSDVAARGRSLGVHLVLCTQHPASVVRDTISANCPVRLSFRVTEAASGGIVGDRARELVGAPPGRAVLADEHGARLLQVAVVDDDDIAAVLERWRGHPAAGSTWCAPLPERLGPEMLPPIDGVGDRDAAAYGQNSRAIESITFGVLDDPDQRCRRRAIWSPQREGALAVLGASQSGRSAVLATLAAGVPESARVLVIPADVPEAWQVLEQLATHAHPVGLLVCDRLDALLVRAGDRAGEVTARWDAAVRAVRAAGGAAVASFSAASAAGSLLVGRFESRVVLRCSDADEHAVCGAPRGLFDRTASAGRGWWNELQLQVMMSETPLPAPEPAPARGWHPDPDHDVIVISSRAAEVADRVAVAGLRHHVVLDLDQVAASSVDPPRSVATAPRLIVAAPSDWQAAWSFLAAARSRLSVVLDSVEASEVRSLLGLRDVLPPTDARRGEFWLSEPGRPIERAAWPVLGAESGGASGGG